MEYLGNLNLLPCDACTCVVLILVLMEYLGNKDIAEELIKIIKF